MNVWTRIKPTQFERGLIWAREVKGRGCTPFFVDLGLEPDSLSKLSVIATRLPDGSQLPPCDPYLVYQSLDTPTISPVNFRGVLCCPLSADDNLKALVFPIQSFESRVLLAEQIEKVIERFGHLLKADPLGGTLAGWRQLVGFQNMLSRTAIAEPIAGDYNLAVNLLASYSPHLVQVVL